MRDALTLRLEGMSSDAIEPKEASVCATPSKGGEDCSAEVAWRLLRWLVWLAPSAGVGCTLSSALSMRTRRNRGVRREDRLSYTEGEAMPTLPCASSLFSEFASNDIASKQKRVPCDYTVRAYGCYSCSV